MANYIPCNRKINVHYYNTEDNKAWEEPVIAFEILEGNGGLVPLVFDVDGEIQDMKVKTKSNINCYLVVDGERVDYSKRVAYRDLIREEEN